MEDRFAWSTDLPVRGAPVVVGVDLASGPDIHSVMIETPLGRFIANGELKQFVAFDVARSRLLTSDSAEPLDNLVAGLVDPSADEIITLTPL